MITRMGAYNPGMQVDNLGLLGDFGRPQLQTNAKRDWRASLFDKLNPGADADMSDGDRERLGRAGLMQLASGLLGTGGGFGNALAAGLTGGQKAMSQGVDDMASQQYKRMIAAQQGAAPGEFRARDMTAQAAGFKPGTPEYQNFMQVQGGIVGKASSAATKVEMVEDANGVKRPHRAFNDGRVEVWQDEMGEWLPLDAQASAVAPPMPQPMPPSGLLAPNGQPVNLDGLDPNMDPAERASIMASIQYDNAQAGGGGLLGDAVPPPRRTAAGMGLGRGRPAEVEAAAKQAATESVTLGNMPYRNQLEAQGAGMTQDAKNASDIAAYTRGTEGVIARETASATAKAQAERDAVAATKRVSGMDTLDLLDQAEGLVGISTGSGAGAMVDKAAAFWGKSTTGAEAIAALKTIGGQLVAKMPRMEGPQSDRDVQMYKDMAGDLANPETPHPQRMAALQMVRSLNAKYAHLNTPAAQDRPAAAKRLKFNPATGRIE